MNYSFIFQGFCYAFLGYIFLLFKTDFIKKQKKLDDIYFKKKEDEEREDDGLVIGTGKEIVFSKGKLVVESYSSFIFGAEFLSYEFFGVSIMTIIIGALGKL